MIRRGRTRARNSREPEMPEWCCPLIRISLARFRRRVEQRAFGRGAAVRHEQDAPALRDFELDDGASSSTLGASYPAGG